MPQVGDVVISTCPYNPGKNVCKRVTAVAGDKLPVPALRFEQSIDKSDVIPPGYCYLRGDNASNSFDSRSYGPIPVSLIKGRVVCKLRLSYPFVHAVESYEHKEEVSEMIDAAADNSIPIDPQQLQELLQLLESLHVSDSADPGREEDAAREERDQLVQDILNQIKTDK